MKQYQELLQTILDTGTQQANRTGIDTVFIPGAQLKFDLKSGFPAVTTKKLFFDMVKGEMIGHLRGYSNAADFRGLGCGVWDDNANKNVSWLDNPNRKGQDDLGRIYGVQWREWAKVEKKRLPLQPNEIASRITTSFGTVDQVWNVLQKILTNPTDRRMIINGWRPDELDQMALPPCHLLYQFIANVTTKELHLCMYQRSCDMFLGVPFNIAGAGLMLSLFAQLTGYTPRILNLFLADAHIYVNHRDQVREQIRRIPYVPPALTISLPEGELKPDIFHRIQPNDIQLVGYEHHPAIKAPMAI